MGKKANDFSDFVNQREQSTPPALKTQFDTILQNNPEFVKYLNQGRTQLGDISQGMKITSDFNAYLNSELNRLRKEDKMITNYYELATGRKADQTILDKFGQYASDPALLTAAISKESMTAPAIGQYRDQINATVQEKMGRPATEAEISSFGKHMEQGNLDTYGLGEFLQGTSEYQNKYTDVARQKLAGELGAVDTDYLNKIQKQLESKYAAAGRPGASAFGSALIGAGKDLATQRTGYLADIGYQGALGGQEALKSAYQNRLSQMYANQQGTQALGSESRNRYYSQQDYDRQAAAQERLRQLSQPKQGSFLQGIAPGLITAAGTIGGTLIGGPAGAMVGSQVGSYLSPKLSVNNAYGRY